ncbi:hypothetical protein [Azospirillum sp.]|uniref:hypothetical protein n=1 Tax=Azospirillum sp. TaxID=34012 RepID=UPI003D719753
MNVLFPANTGQRYYDIHFRSVLEVLRHGGAHVELEEIPSESETLIIVNIDGQWTLFDCSDAGLWRSDSRFPVFKFHHRTDERYANVFPFAPVSFFNWVGFGCLRAEVAYDPARAMTIAMRQRPYGNAVERRNAVLAQLRAAFTDRLACDLLPQPAFWRNVSSIRLAVCVPGQNNNMLDRGQYQYMALGAATVSPYLPELLPFDATLDGCYIPCRDDYADLTAVIDGIDDEALLATGRRAADLFQRTSMPDRLVEWVDRCLARYRAL